MKYLLAGGGTGGHIYPAIAIANEILKNEPDAKILFVGTKNGLESELVPRSGFELKIITVQGFKRKISFDTLRTVKKAIIGLRDANRILNDFKPDVVIGTGGYVCGPVVMMAALKRIPTIIHEQNAYPGMTNRILSRFAKIVAVSYDDSIKYFYDKSKIVVTGNPIRSELLEGDKFQSIKRLGFSPDTPLVVSVGGSRGAEKINLSMLELAKRKDNKFQLLIITGSKQYDNVVEQTKLKNVDIDDNMKIIPYCHNMSDVYAAADIIVCRAGAITLAELTARGVPSILIPSPYVTNNHQEYNARALEKSGAAFVILEKDVSGDILYDKIMYLLNNPEMIDRMRHNAKKLSKINATSELYKLIKTLT